MQYLQKIVSRYYCPIMLTAWYRGATTGLKKVMGVGFSDIVMHYNGNNIDIYRLAGEMHSSIKSGMLKYVKTKAYLNGRQQYKKEYQNYEKKLKNNPPLKDIINGFIKPFPIMCISYYISNIFNKDVKGKDRLLILRKCRQYRDISNSLMDITNRAIEKYLQLHKLSSLALPNGTYHAWMKKSFIFSKGKFYNIAWDDFLKKKKYEVIKDKHVNLKNNLKGNCAYPGKVSGIVKVVFSPKDFSKVKKNDILVCPMTQVSYLPLFKKVIGITTDEGGITCHAAIISRELKIPCIIGTKIATQVLKDGDRVEVDAEQGIIRKL